MESIGEKIDSIRTAFNGILFNQYYPVKTNPCLDIVRYCVDNGLGIDACSMGDLEVADMLDVPPENISFTGVGLNEHDMRALYKKMIVPNLCSQLEVKRWGRLFPGS